MIDPAAPLAQAVAGRYRIGDAVGRGGMSVVYRADDVRHGRSVAIKVFTETVGRGGSDRFLREIGFLARLNHPHILPLLDSGSAEGLLYYVMPLVEGESLRERMSREPRLSVQEVVRLLVEVCDALRYAHAQHIVHRDIKPENILLVDRHAVVADFGVARALHAGDTGTGQTTGGVAVGTPAYMSPEQAAADPQVDHRADIYALGVVAFELFNGEPPFAHDSPHVILASHVTATPPDLAALRPDLPTELSAVIMRCLAKRPEERWADAGALREAFEPFLLPSGAVTPAPMPPVRSARRRFQIGAIGAGVLAITVVALRLAFPPPRMILLGEPRRLGVATEMELDPAISPDGRMVAYASGTLGAMQIRVRQLAGGEAVTVAPGVSASQRWPHWDPDGTSLSFQADGTIYSAPPLGGAVRTLEEGNTAHPAGGFAWSPDGTHVAYVKDGTLYTRPAQGGQPQALAHDGAAHSPAWSPDGRWIAYVSGNAEFTYSEALLGNIAPSTLRVVPSSGGHPMSLTDGRGLATSPVWLDERTLGFVGGGGATNDLFALRLTRGGRAAGPPMRLTTGLHLHSVARFPGAAELVYVQLDHVANVWAVPIPGPGEPVASIRDGRPATEGDQVIEDLDVFPVGGLLLFDSNRGGSQDIWLQTGPTAAPVAITTDPADEFGPVWSPNGREVAYYAVRDGVRHLFVMSVTGQGQVQVTNDSLQDQQPQWSPDGNSLVFYRRDGAGNDRLYVTTRDADSTWSAPRRLTDELGTACHWSSDGRWIAFTDPDGDLRVVDAQGGPSRVVARPDEVGGLPIRRPHWLFGAFAMLARVEGPGGTGGIWRFSILGDPPEELIRFDDPDRPVYRTDIAADRREVYVVVSHFGTSLWRIPVGAPDAADGAPPH
jgi:eukaryotic-like serine/threonine-protein kinase